MAYFNYRNPDPTDFEAFAKDVMERILGCRLFRYGPGGDDGIDLCDNIREKHIVVQCKKFQQGSFYKLYSVLKREEKPKLEKLNPRPERYYVFTSLELSHQQKQKILDLFQEYMDEESCIIDGIAINDFFRDEQNHDLISRNIKLFQSFPDNYQGGSAKPSQTEKNALYERLLRLFENDRQHHPSIRMMDPNPLLFPKGLPEILSDGRLAVGEKEEPRAVRDIILESWKREERRHILLVGEGGIGKTVAMLTLPEEDWFKKLGIPVIYVPLQKLDTYEGDLNRYIKEKIGFDSYERCLELANRTFKGHPNLLLLLDGFNEIPDIFKHKAERYIREWTERPGIQIITTSRTGLFLENRFSKFLLQPLPYDTVMSFLLSTGMAEEQLPKQNDRIWGVINVPLMLTVYSQIAKVRETNKWSSIVPILEWREPDNAAHIIWDYLQMELYRCIEKHDASYSAVRYAAAILVVAPYVCCQMSNRKKLYIKRDDIQKCIREALTFYAVHQDLLDSQFLYICEVLDPYDEEEPFQEENAAGYARILVDNIGLFQTQKIRKMGPEIEFIIENTCIQLHQNFRDALAAFFICSCLSKTYDTKEKRALLNQADYYVKNYMVEHLSVRELIFIWDKHRKEDPEDGQITFILMDLIGRQRDHDYRELNFSNIDLSKTNLHRLLSRRVDICPLPEDSDKFISTRISANCLSPNGHVGGVRSIAFSPDGRRLASGADDGKVQIWTIENGESCELESHTGGIRSVVFSFDGRQLASGADDGKILIWNSESGESLVLEGYAGGIRSIAFSPDGKLLASATYDEAVRIWSLESGESRVLEDHADWVNSVTFSPDGRQLAGCADDETVRIWNLESDESRVLGDHAGWFRSVAFSPDGRQLASGADDGKVQIWDLDSGESVVLEGCAGGINSVAFSPYGRRLASGADDGKVRIWDLESGESRVLEGHVGAVNSVFFSPDGRQLASGADDWEVRIWDFESGESVVLEGRAGEVFSVAFSPDGRQLASGADDRLVRVWDLESGDCRILEGCTVKVRSISISPNGRQLASAADDGTVRVWDLASGESRVLEGHAGVVRSVSFSPDGRQLASGADDGKVRIWDLESDESYVLEGYKGGVNGVAFSPDGRQLASGADDDTVRIWDFVENRVLGSHADWVKSVAFSPDGRQLASGSDDGTIRVWNLESGESCVFEGHSGGVKSVAFSPDGRLVISGSDDGTVRVWNLESGESYVFEGHPGGVNCVAVSPNGRQIASGADDRTVRIWDLEKFQETGKYAIISHINLKGANFELAIIDEKDKEMLRAAGARC